MRHEKNGTSLCKAAPAGGWTFDAASGTLQVADANASDWAATAARGGMLNAAARDILGRYGMPTMGGFAYR